MHIIVELAQQGVICPATRRGKQHTFALLDEWIPKNDLLSKEEALYELALKYFTSRGPATLYDFIWWSGLSPEEARTALRSVEDKLEQFTIDNNHYWSNPTSLSLKTSTLFLPAFDEYLIAYKNRSAAVNSETRISTNGIFSPVIIHNGLIEGTWKRIIDKGNVHITTHFNRKAKVIDDAIRKEALRYSRFLGLTAHVK